MISALSNKVFSISSDDDFDKCALEIFNLQASGNSVYQLFLSGLGRDKLVADSIRDISFLPVEFFRNQKIVTGNRPIEIIFKSSSTTGTVPGRHFVSDLSLYEKSFQKSFSRFYGDLSDYVIFALLPSYTDREGSSLVYMADKLIKMTSHPLSGFYKDDHNRLVSSIMQARKDKRKLLLLGVSFALLDLAEDVAPDLSEVIVMETGGMKGRRKELPRAELHSVLMKLLNIKAVHSEYGMTELMSQAYSYGNGIFYTPPWMKIVLRDPQDPLTTFTETGRTGGINIIDLANINSCAFIATSDLGRLHEDGGFEVLGRFDNSDIRGCNLMIE